MMKHHIKCEEDLVSIIVILVLITCWCNGYKNSVAIAVEFDFSSRLMIVKAVQMLVVVILENVIITLIPYCTVLM